MTQHLKMPDTFPVTAHTDFVEQDGTFIVIKGFKQDGLEYVPLALQKGARTIVISSDITMPESLKHLIAEYQAHLEVVDDTRLALAQLSAKAAGYPARQLRIIGITGTKGKTTTTFLLAHLFKTAGIKTAFMSTVYNSIDGVCFRAPLTTAQPDYLHQFLKLCVEQSVTTVVMEVAAQAMTMHRVAGIAFDGIILTNFSQEHSEFYASMNDYFAAKESLLQLRKPEAPALINSDNPWCARLMMHEHTMSVSLHDKNADYYADVKQVNPAMCMTVHAKNNECYDLYAPTLLGTFNAYNILGAYAMASMSGVTRFDCAKALETFTCVPGRMQKYTLPNGATCIIDYAHNPESFEQLFSLLGTLTNDLIVVFGAGGERDTTKRPLMGTIAARYAQRIVLTSDNPRSEMPSDIVQDILVGIEQSERIKVSCELDREQAIKHAYAVSNHGSIIVLLGKGPDEYQIIGTKKIFFSESSIIQSLV